MLSVLKQKKTNKSNNHKRQGKSLSSRITYRSVFNVSKNYKNRIFSIFRGPPNRMKWLTSAAISKQNSLHFPLCACQTSEMYNPHQNLYQLIKWLTKKCNVKPRTLFIFWGQNYNFCCCKESMKEVQTNPWSFALSVSALLASSTALRHPAITVCGWSFWLTRLSASWNVQGYILMFCKISVIVTKKHHRCWFVWKDKFRGQV